MQFVDLTMLNHNIKDSQCQRLNCAHYIIPAKSGFGGGVMARHGRCGLTLRMVHRMPACPKNWIVPTKEAPHA